MHARGFSLSVEPLWRTYLAHMSLICAPALVMGDEPNVPASKRAMRRVSMFCDTAQTRLKTQNKGYDIANAAVRP